MHTTHVGPPPVTNPPATTRIPAAPLVGAAVAGGLVAVALGVYGRVHTPTGQTVFDFGFSSTLAMKAWLATAAATLALVQAATAAWMFGQIGHGPAPAWAGAAHRWTGTAAFLLTLPVAYHCLWALGYQTTTARVAAHSFLGCVFYGAMTVKLLALRVERLPRWALPAMGISLVALLSALWLTSSYWYFTTVAFAGA